MNKFNEIKIEKVTLNIGVGAPGERLQNAKTLLERFSGKQAVFTQAKSRNPTFKIRKGDQIGVKVTIRRKPAEDVLKRCLETNDNLLSLSNFDRTGNVAFGIKEYIDVPGMKYDPKIGMMGFDVAVTLTRPGKRVAIRQVATSRVPRAHKVTKEEAVAFMKKTFGVKMREEEEKEE